MQFSPNFRGIICILLACLFFIFCDSFLKLLLRDMPPLQTLVVRGVAATITGFALVIALGFSKDIARTFGLWTFLRALAEVVSVFAFIFALSRAPIADVTAIYQIAPLLVLGAASFLFGEKVGPLRWLLIGLGFAGALVVAQPGSESASPYALLAFVTAFGSALRDLLSHKVPRDLPGPVVALTVVISVLTAAIAGTALFEDWQPLQPVHYIYAAGAGFFVMLAHMLIYLAFRLAPARNVTPFYYSLTVFAAMAGALFFDEFPNTMSLIGIAMILACGLGVLALEERKS